MKRLYRSRKEKMVAGVCGGLGEYFDADPVLIRIIFLVFFFLGGTSIIAYAAGWIIMPEKSDATSANEGEESGTEKRQHEENVVSSPPANRSNQPMSQSKGSLILGIGLVMVGGYFFLDNFRIFRKFFWWINWHIGDFIVPGIFIILGLLLLVNGAKKGSGKEEVS